MTKVKMTFNEVSDIMIENNKKPQHSVLYAVAVINEKCFGDELSEIERSFVFDSKQKHFSNVFGDSVFADCLDGSESFIRLDLYIKGNGYYGWKWIVDYCYFVTEEELQQIKEMQK